MRPHGKSPAKSRGESEFAVSRKSSVRNSSRRQALTRTSAASDSDGCESRSQIAALNEQDLWIAPRTTLSSRSTEVAWGRHPATPTHARLLELADIALGLRKPQAFRRRRSLFLASQSIQSTKQ